MSHPLTRRTFTKATAAATLGFSALSAGKVRGANDRIRLGAIGVGNRGNQVLDGFRTHADVEIVALCDVSASTVAKTNNRIGGKAQTFSDFRKLLDRDDVDAVLVATPDHWHAIQTIMACDAGKDVYVEKPLSITIHEGRRMVEAARRNRRVVQVGTQRRSAPAYVQAAELVASGKLGKVTVSRAFHASNMYPSGMGRAKPSPPPADLDWDMWLGPRPDRPYQSNITPYKFRWWQLYSSQMANWGVHFLDAIRWITGELAPASVCALGGRFAVDDDRTIPDTMQAVFQFASGRLAILGQFEASGNPTLPYGEAELRGTQGTLYTECFGYRVLPERGGQFQDRKPRMEPVQVRLPGRLGDLVALHTRNFLDCVKSRAKPCADGEIGHRSTTLSLLANISLAVGKRLEWDAQAERFLDCDEANAMLHYEYRKPWTLG